MNRIDIHTDVPAVECKELRGTSEGDSSGTICERVIEASKIQLERLSGEGIYSNSAMQPRHIRKFCELDTDSENQLERAMLKQGLSAISHDRILKVSRTIADLDKSKNIQSSHICVYFMGKAYLGSKYLVQSILRTFSSKALFSIIYYQTLWFISRKFQLFPFLQTAVKRANPFNSLSL